MWGWGGEGVGSGVGGWGWSGVRRWSGMGVGGLREDGVGLGVRRNIERWGGEGEGSGVRSGRLNPQPSGFLP